MTDKELLHHVRMELLLINQSIRTYLVQNGLHEGMETSKDAQFFFPWLNRQENLRLEVVSHLDGFTEIDIDDLI